MKAYLQVCAVLALCLVGRAEPAPGPAPDIFKPEWLASYLPARLLVLKSDGPEAVQKPFREALLRLQQSSPVQLVAFPAGQHAPAKKSGETMEGRTLKSGDGGFLVLVSQTGKVVAIHVAYATDKDWAKEIAAMIARTTFDPAIIDGRPVPTLLCWRWAFDNRVNIH